MDSKKSFLTATLLSLALSTFALTPLAMADDARPDSPNRAALGSATYKPMRLYKLAEPISLWTDDDLLLEKKIAHPSDAPEIKDRKMLNLLGYASKVEGERQASYTRKSVPALVDAYGGTGLNGNYGSGRAAILGEWQLKGSGKTMMVNPNSDAWHRNGASSIGEGVWEAAWSTLLYKELPYGAYRILSVFATGSDLPQGDDRVPRVVIVREDPLRPAHYLVNSDASEDQPDFEKKRIAQVMKNLVEALPKPYGYVSQGRVADFRAGFAEFIHRQAVQQGYMWAHSLVHGAIVPANAGLDGRTLDFGTFSAFDGYPKVAIITEPGFANDFSVDLLKNLRDSWVQTLPSDLLAALPTQHEMFNVYEEEFQNARHLEILRVAGAFTELTNQLYQSPDGQDLANILVQLAQAGNERQIDIWNGQNPFHTGTYDLGQILVTLAKLPMGALSANQSELRELIPDQILLQKLVRSYKRTFELQRNLARAQGISGTAEKSYRLMAAQIRNAKMTSLYRKETIYGRIDKMVAQQKADPHGRAFEKLINSLIHKSRREYWDAKPFTLVLKEVPGPHEDEKTRRVFDAHTGQVSNIVVKTSDVVAGNAIENRQKTVEEIYHRPGFLPGLRCVDLFAN